MQKKSQVKKVHKGGRVLLATLVGVAALSFAFRKYILILLDVIIPW